MKMIRRKENAKQEVKQEKVVGIVEIPVTAEADCFMTRDRGAPSRSRSPRGLSRLSTTSPPPTAGPPTTVIRVDLINLLNDLEAELRRFHGKVRRAQDTAA